VKYGDIAIDIGANFGLYTDRLARLVGPGGTVYAFEPHPDYGRALKRMAATHGNIKLFDSALSDKPGRAHLSVPTVDGERAAPMSSLQSRPDAPGTETVQVSLTTLEAVAGSLSSIRFIKCDVEGHEHEVLIGAREVLRRSKPVLLIEVEQRHRRRAVGETFDLLSRLGYDGYMLTAKGPRPLAEFDVQEHQLALIAADPSTTRPPAGYVNDFLFLPSGMPLPVPPG